MDELIVLLGFMMLIAIQVMIVFALVWLLRKRQAWPFIMAAIKGRGSLLCKADYDRTISFTYTDKPVTEVEWKVKDKVSKKTRILKTSIKRIYHTLKGTGINVHFLPITYPTNIDITTKEKSQLDVDEINAGMAQEYAQGLLDASTMHKIGGLDIQMVQLVLLAVIVAALLVNAYFTMQVMGAVGA